MEITCPECRMSGVVRAEVNFLDQLTKNGSNPLADIQKIFGRVADEGSIRDEDIVSLRENLKSCHSVEELFE